MRSLPFSVEKHLFPARAALFNFLALLPRHVLHARRPDSRRAAAVRAVFLRTVEPRANVADRLFPGAADGVAHGVRHERAPVDDLIRRFHIHPGAQIGPWFFIDHGTGIVIGETTVIGSHVKLYQGVTLGALSPRAGHASLPGKRHPTVCDYVTIYSGASILGGETVIGEHSVVGGNAFLTGSVADNTRVVITAPETLFKNAE